MTLSFRRCRNPHGLVFMHEHGDEGVQEGPKQEGTRCFQTCKGGPDAVSVPVISEFQASKPQRIRNHGNRAEAHCGRCDHGAEQQTGEGVEDPRRNRHTE